MKIHWPMSLPPVPPAVPVKPPPTQFEVQGVTDELIAIAERERLDRARRVNAAKNRERSQEEHGEQRPESSGDKLDLLA